MDVRKVQRTSGGTFFVCLPKKWAERNGIDRGSFVSITESMNGRLVINAKYDAISIPQIVIINPTQLLDREIVGTYLLGYDVIQVEAKDRITPSDRECVKQVSGQLIGLEIVEENYSRIVMQCLLEPSAFPPEKILRREYSIVSSMHRDAVTAFVEGDIHLARNIIDRDNEVDRLYFLLVRILRTVIRNPKLSEKLGILPIDCLDYRLTASLVEAIGDQATQVAQNTIELNKKISKEISHFVSDLHKYAYDSHESALNALFSRDVSLAASVRAKQGTVAKVVLELEKTARTQPLEVVPHILDIASSMNRIYDHSIDIADLVMPKLA